jgi:hypothetical protein
MGHNGTQNLAPRHEEKHSPSNANVPFTDIKIAKKVTKILQLSYSVAHTLLFRSGSLTIPW